MNDENQTHSALTTPWTLKIFNALPRSSLQKGTEFILIVFLAFFLGRFLRDSSTNTVEGDFQLAIIHLLLTIYSACAYVYLLNVTKKAAIDLAPFGEQSQQWKKINTGQYIIRVRADCLNIYRIAIRLRSY